jgi:rhodanese-related sulfurtransferase
MAQKSAADLIRDAKGRIREVTPRDVMGMVQRGETVALIDVREDREWNLGHLPNALHMSRGTLEGKIETAIPRDRKVVLYCASGNRSALAADMLQQMGYSDVASMSGGLKGWVAGGGDVDG